MILFSFKILIYVFFGLTKFHSNDAIRDETSEAAIYFYTDASSEARSKFEFVQPPRPPRIYAQAPSGLGVTRVRARPVTGELKPNPKSINTLNTTKRLQSIQPNYTRDCFPQYFLYEDDMTDYEQFVIDRCDGLLSTARYVDKNIGQFYKIVLLAVDANNKSLATLKMKIEVTHYNSKPPHLMHTQYSQEILDSTKVGTRIMTLTASDNDSESYNKELYFSLQNASNIDKDPWLYPTLEPLKIDFNAGAIVITAPLNNYAPTLHFQVGVTDGGSPQRTHSSKMVLHVRSISAPRNVKIMNNTETSITVCWSPPFQGTPEGYVITYKPRFSQQGLLNVTVQQLEMGNDGLSYGTIPYIEDQQRKPDVQQTIQHFFTAQYCAVLDGLSPFTQYGVSVRGWSFNQISMARVPITTVTRKRSCNSELCAHGVCQELNASPGYSCICAPGYYGQHCEMSDPCYSDPTICKNGATCLREVNEQGYRCHCGVGFLGLTCDTIDPCRESNPCLNRGQCLYEGSLRCRCQPLFTGAFCEISISETIFHSVCLPDNITGPKGSFNWPQTLHGVTVVHTCPYGDIPETTNNNQTTILNNHTSSEEAEAVRVEPLYSQSSENPAYDYVTEQPTTMKRVSRSLVGVAGAPEATIIYPIIVGDGLPHKRYSRSVIPSRSASRTCIANSDGSAAWQEPDLSYCRNARDETSSILSLTSSPDEVNSTMLVNSVKELSLMVDKALHDSKIASNIMRAFSNLLNAKESVFETSNGESSNTSDLIMATINSYTANVPLQPGENVKLRSDNLVVEAKLLHKENLPEEVSFIPFDDKPTPNEETVWFKIPKSAMQQTDTDHIRLQFVSFKDDRLFRRKNKQKVSNMPVVSATISNNQITNLNSPVTYMFPVNNLDIGNKQLACVYWDKIDKEWSREGLTGKMLDDGKFICESTHLTAFSILLDPVGAPIETHGVFLSIITYVGLTLSTLALLATIATFVLFKSVNRDRSGAIVLNLSIALLLLNISFLGASLIEPSSGACIPFASMLHYAVAASFTWMLIEALNMHQLLVTVFPSAETHFMLKRVALGWGIPFLLVSIALLWNTTAYASNSSSFCVISPNAVPAVYYTTYFAPICLVLMVNLVVFVLVTRVLCQRRPSYNRNSKSSPERPSHKSPPVTVAQIRGAITIMALLGITWIAGIFAVGHLRVVLQYLFCVTTPLQGFIIFLVRVLQNAEARFSWYSLFTTGYKRRRHSRPPSSMRTHSSSHNSSSLHTHSTGVTPPKSVFAAALSAARRLSFKTPQEGAPNDLNLNRSSSGRSNFGNGLSSSSKKNRKFIYSGTQQQPMATDTTPSAVDKIYNRIISLSNRESSESKSEKEKLSGSGSTCEYNIPQEDVSNGFQSQMEEGPLKDLHQILNNHPFFDKSSIERKNSTEERDVEIDETENDEFKLVKTFHASNKNESKTLLNGSPKVNNSLENGMDSVHLSDINSFPVLTNDRNGSFQRSLGSLIPITNQSVPTEEKESEILSPLSLDVKFVPSIKDILQEEKKYLLVEEPPTSVEDVLADQKSLTENTNDAGLKKQTYLCPDLNQSFMRSVSEQNVTAAENENPYSRRSVSST